MTPLWTSNEVLNAIKGTPSSENFWEANGVSIDSRTIMPGNIFIAIDGEKFDGHSYIDEAFQKGAIAAVVSKKIKNFSNKKLPSIIEYVPLDKEGNKTIIETLVWNFDIDINERYFLPNYMKNLR